MELDKLQVWWSSLSLKANTVSWRLKMEDSMEFLESVLRNTITVKSCIEQDNVDLLTLQVSGLVQNFSIFKNALVCCDGPIQQILTSILNILRNLLFECNDFFGRSFENRNFEIRLPSLRQGTVGRSRLDVPEHQVVMLRNCGLTWSKIARVLGISRQTLWNFRHQRNLEDPIPRSIICNEELINVINNIKRDHPSIGYKYLWASLKARRIFISWKRLITLVRFIDPVGVLSRRRRRLRRRQYRVKGANYLWWVNHLLTLYWRKESSSSLPTLQEEVKSVRAWPWHSSEYANFNYSCVFLQNIVKFNAQQAAPFKKEATQLWPNCYLTPFCQKTVVILTSYSASLDTA